MSKLKKIRYTNDKSVDSDYQFGVDESSGEDDESIQPSITTSSGRLSRPPTIDTSNTGKNDETKDDNDISVQIPMKRTKIHETDRSCAPDFSKVARYLTAVKQTRNNSIHFLNEEELKTVQSGRQTLSQFWRTRLDKICPNSQNDKPLDFSCWKKIDDLSASLTRWLGTKSIGLVIQCSIPNGIQSLDDESEKPPSDERIPLPVKLSRKRGRPRKNQLWKINRLLESPEVEHYEKNSLTVNEHLQSLVSEQIEATSSIINQMKKTKGRSTNNSVASALTDLSSLPSTSFNSVLHVTSSSQHKNIANNSPNKKKLKSKSAKSASQKTVKMEIEDFSLPAEFSHGINFPISTVSLLLPTNNNKIKNSRTKTSNRSHSSNSTLNTTTPEEALNNPSTSNEKIPHKIQNGGNLHSKSFLTPSIRKELNKTDSKKDKHGIIDLPFSKDEQINVPIFSGKTFPFDVDVSPTVQHFESVQVVDIFNTLTSEPSSAQETTTYASLTSSQNDLDLFYQNRINRQKLQKIKSNRQFAQTLFCGGPIADIAVCPHALPDGKELFVVATFADEKYLDCNHIDDLHSYLQVWTTNIMKSTDNDDDHTNDPKLAFLLRIPNAKHVCSVTWCPAQIKAENIKSSPLGLLAISTFTGRIHIYSIPSDLDTLINSHFCSSLSSSTGNESIPLILESIPLLTLSHDPLRKIKMEEVKEEENDRRNSAISSLKEGLDSIPLFKVQWSPFDGSRHIAAISASWFVYIWSIFGDSNEVTLPLWTLPIDGLLSPPMSIGWLEQDKICVSYRNKQFHAYKLLYPSLDNTQSTYLTRLILECESAKGSGIFCNTRPLLFPGALTFDSYAFTYLGTQQQSLCYLALQQKIPFIDSEEGCIDQVTASNLSNCHQIRLTSACICPNSGICTSVGADGRLCCSLNGRVLPKNVSDIDNFMHGRALLQLISHRKNPVSFEDDDDIVENEDNSFCFSHEDCLAKRFLEIRLGDCAILEQRNERVNGRSFPETCVDRRLEALTVIDCSHNSVGLTFCGGDSGLVFIVPCTL